MNPVGTLNYANLESLDWQQAKKTNGQHSKKLLSGFGFLTAINFIRKNDAGNNLNPVNLSISNKLLRWTCHLI